MTKLTWPAVVLIVALTFLAFATTFGILGWLVAGGKAPASVLVIPLSTLLTAGVSAAVYQLGRKAGHDVGKNELPPWLEASGVELPKATITVAPPAVPPTLRPPPAPSPEPARPTTLVETTRITDTSWAGAPPDEEPHGRS